MEVNRRVHCLSADEIAEGILWALYKPAHLCVAKLEITATEHVIGGVRYKGMQGRCNSPMPGVSRTRKPPVVDLANTMCAMEACRAERQRSR